ncbi:MAG: hypothetical protein KA791_01160 [Flavobacteriales bacterium]|nr:hypothetical protein [Flavobacteriales bacterium]
MKTRTMSEDKHFPPSAPVPEALQDHEPTDKPAAKGILYAIVAVFAASVLILAIIYNNTHEEDAGREPVPPATESTR